MSASYYIMVLCWVKYIWSYHNWWFKWQIHAFIYAIIRLHSSCNIICCTYKPITVLHYELSGKPANYDPVIIVQLPPVAIDLRIITGYNNSWHLIAPVMTTIHCCGGTASAGNSIMKHRKQRTLLNTYPLLVVGLFLSEDLTLFFSEIKSKFPTWIWNLILS